MLSFRYGKRCILGSVERKVVRYVKEESVVSNLSTRRMTHIAADGRSVINEELLDGTDNGSALDLWSR